MNDDHRRIGEETPFIFTQNKYMRRKMYMSDH